MTHIWRVEACGPSLLRLDRNGAALDLPVRYSPRARRMRLRVVPDGVELVLPQGMKPAAAADFVRRNATWVMRQQAGALETVVLSVGASVPIEGDMHAIAQPDSPSARGPAGERVAWRGDGCLIVRGDPAHVPRRVESWLRGHAADTIRPCAAAKAALIDRPPPPVSVRDQSSRWGSCSAAGRLNFSWRLVMAPPAVLDYVVAHEVAHLREMNHGPAFWRLCGALTDGGADSAARSRKWLQRHGRGLHRYTSTHS